MDWKIWAMFVLTEGALCLSPGPAVLLVCSQGLHRGGRASLWCNAGILSGNAIYFLLSAAGLGVVLLASHQLFTAIKWAGAAYLVWLGIRTLSGRASPLAIADADRPGDANWRMLVKGLVLQLANPKALIFFTALLPQFLDPSRSLPIQFAVLAVTSMVIEFFVLLAYGAAAGRMASLAARPRFASWVNRVSGGFLVAAGVGVAVARRA